MTDELYHKLMEGVPRRGAVTHTTMMVSTGGATLSHNVEPGGVAGDDIPRLPGMPLKTRRTAARFLLEWSALWTAFGREMDWIWWPWPTGRPYDYMKDGM